MAAMLRSLTYYQGIPVWRHVQVIQWATQIISGILVVALVVWFFANIGNEIRERDIPYGFDFLDISPQTAIGQHFLPHESSDTYQDALIVAFTNTLVVSIAGVILATALGTVIGVARLSSNWIVSKAALVYIDFFRNVPLLVQLVFWFYIVLALPQAREGYVIDHRLYLNNGGLSIPWPSPGSLESALFWFLVVVAGIAVGVIANRWLTAREVRTGSASYPVLMGCTIAAVIGAVGWVVIGAVSGESPFGISFPRTWRLRPRPPRKWPDLFGRADGAAGWAGDVHRRIHSRDREGRHSVGEPWTDRGVAGAGAIRDEYTAPRYFSAGIAGHCASAD